MVVNLCVLGFFKYEGFVLNSLNAVLPVEIPFQEVALPVGISFYTFQILSYIIDVYRGNVPVQKNLMDFALYVTMFPQLIAGPIVKYAEIDEQLHVREENWGRFGEGVMYFIRGLAKKVLLANTVGMIYTNVSGMAPEDVSVVTAWLGCLAYTFQIYFDFSGYSDMAVGLGKMFGFEFPWNFNYPYIAQSVTEFWRRWHISLSSWFREYVYIPLGGNRKGTARTLRNILIVWLLTGIWHGADWNFVLWGIYYFVLLTIEKVFLLDKLKKGKVWPHIYTLFLVAVGWALFVGNESGVGLSLLFQKLFIPSGGVGCLYFLRNYGVLLAVCIACCTPLPLKIYDKIKENTFMRIALVGLLLVLCIAYIVASSNTPFLYFRF